MRLSDAIALGRTLMCPHGGGSTRSDARPGDGCVLDMAVVAVRGHGNWQQAGNIWPWLGDGIDPDCRMYDVTAKFDCDVMAGLMTLDQLIDWVRSIEPAEPNEAEKLEQMVEADRDWSANTRPV